MISLVLLGQVMWEKMPDAFKGFITAALAMALFFLFLRLFGVDDHPATQSVP